MENTISPVKKFISTYGIILGVVLGFAGGVFYPSISASSDKLAGSMGSNVSGAIATSPEGVNSTVCGLSQMPANNNSRGVFVSDNDYNKAFTAYKAAHPNEPAGSVSWAGVIGKEYLIAVINSLPATETNVQFCFGTEPNMQTGIYFKGGTLNPITGAAGTTVTVAKTGSDSYCPTHCPN